MFGWNGQVAFRFAQAAHTGQKRKYIGMDYIIHPMRVASLIAHYMDAENDNQVRTEVVPAALLHDVAEDTEKTLEDIENIFGVKIMNLVFEVTNVSVPEDGNRETRNQIDRDHLAQSSYFGASIKLADIADNCGDIVAYDPGFAKTYIPEKIKMLEVLKHGNGDLYKLTERILYNAHVTLMQMEN